MAVLVGASLQGMAGCAGGAAVGSLTATGAVAPNPSSSAGAAGIEQLRPDHGRSQPAPAAVHPLPSAAPAIAAAATAAGASCVGLAAGIGGADPNQMAAAGAEQDRLKNTSSVQDYDLKDTDNVVQAALEVMQLCEKLKVSLGWSNMVLNLLDAPSCKKNGFWKGTGAACGLNNVLLQERSNMVLHRFVHMVTCGCFWGCQELQVVRRLSTLH